MDLSQQLTTPSGQLVRITSLDIGSYAATASEDLPWDAEERSRRFVFPKHRQSFLSSRLLLRLVLCRQASCGPWDLRFHPDERGKLILVAPPAATRILFSHSRSGSRLVVGVSDEASIGIDIEQARYVPEATAIEKRYFTLQERRAIGAVSRGEKDLAFLRGWTVKEAVLKALGSGLGVNPRLVDAAAAVRGKSLMRASVEGYVSKYWVRLLCLRQPDSPECDYVVAVAVAETTN
jgi:4'-phosphopantetheinyl transferase